MPSPLRTWLQLFRAPNLFTVPGDPLAGYVLAAYGAFESHVFYALGASVCFYAAGLLDNDLADLAEDLADRPLRPLPSGAARPRTVAIVAAILVGTGFLLAAKLGAAAVTISAALVVAVGFYNHLTKHLPLIGALNMGACRGLSLLLGAAAAPHPELLWRLLAAGRLNPLLTACALVTLYIAAITHLARFETKTQSPPLAKWLPALVLIIGSVSFLSQLHTVTLWSFPMPALRITNTGIAACILAVAVTTNFTAALHLVRDANAAIPPVIGQFIRLLLLIQTAFCIPSQIAAAEAAAFASNYINIFLCLTLLLLSWPVSREVSKRFYAS